MLSIGVRTHASGSHGPRLVAASKPFCSTGPRVPHLVRPLTHHPSIMDQLDMDLKLVRIYRSLQCSEFEKAMIELEQLLEEVPDHGVAHSVKAEVCARLLDDHKRAKLHYDFAIK